MSEVSEGVVITVTWQSLLPVMLEVIKHGGFKSQQTITEEFKKMARAADLWNEHERRQHEETSE